jgi:septal ring factor EnvC (AmiA/AmiB activator)
LAEALGEATQGDLATKGDLASVRNEIAEVRAEIAETEIAQLRSELRTEIAAVRTEMAEMKAELLKWIIGAVGIQTVVILGALASLIKIIAK